MCLSRSTCVRWRDATAARWKKKVENCLQATHVMPHTSVVDPPPLHPAHYAQKLWAGQWHSIYAHLSNLHDCELNCCRCPHAQCNSCNNNKDVKNKNNNNNESCMNRYSGSRQVMQVAQSCQAKFVARVWCRGMWQQAATAVTRCTTKTRQQQVRVILTSFYAFYDTLTLWPLLKLMVVARSLPHASKSLRFLATSMLQLTDCCTRIEAQKIRNSNIARTLHSTFICIIKF